MSICKLGNEMELIETYNFGRRVRGFFRCGKCGETKTKKIGLIPNIVGKKYSASQGCKVPWGKSKTHKRNPKKKKRR